MKKSMILVMAAAAAALALVSCTKETTDSNESGNANEGLRTLTVSFAPNTRTYLDTDGLKPLWTGDGTEKISLNGEDYTVPAEAAGKDSFTLTTTIVGDITAVYPASAWNNSAPYFIVGASQDGSFANANICVASAKAGDTELSFKNQTAIIKVSVPSGTKQLTVTSLNPVSSSTGRRATSGAVAIADASATTITVGNNTADIPNPCYVSVLPGTVLLQDLNFDTGSAQGGFSPKYITSKGKTPSSYAVEVNTMYTLEAASLHDYVTVAGKKWATMNVGASSSTDKGTFFAWGDVTGQNVVYLEFSTGGFYWDKCPFVSYYYYDEEANEGEGQQTITLTKYYNGVEEDEYTVYYNCTRDDKTTLDLEYDAAFCNWGGAWRMPTREEFITLAGAKQSWDGSKNGWTFGNPSIFLPAAGGGPGWGWVGGPYGYYWSSSLDPVIPSSAYLLYFTNSNYVTTNSDYRYVGYPVRPLSE